ncbi:MAG: polyamine aminopropyltransferase [Ignavibacteriales bacterium]
MEYWFTENQAGGLRISLQVEGVLERCRTPYQEAVVSRTAQFGGMLTLDDVIQTTERDEFMYHEMICHVPMCSHPSPRKVLVVGGGDGGVVREILKHPVESVDLIEIDAKVVELARRHLPSISCGLDDPRVRVTIGDGIEFVKSTSDAYDVIIVDSTDPVGPAVGLFAPDFFEAIKRALEDDGMFVAQTGSPFYFPEEVGRVFRSVRGIFPVSGVYLGCVPTYPGGMWSYTIGSKAHGFAAPAKGRAVGTTRYYSPETHAAAFALPPFVKRILEGDVD